MIKTANSRAVLYVTVSAIIVLYASRCPPPPLDLSSTFSHTFFSSLPPSAAASDMFWETMLCTRWPNLQSFLVEWGDWG